MGNLFENIFLVLWFAFIALLALGVSRRENWFVLFWSVFLCGMIAVSSIRSLRRRRAIQRFASTHNLAYTGDLLPASLNLLRTSFAVKDYSTSNCICGHLHSIPIAVFDLSNRKGKTKLTQTVVAFPREGEFGLPDSPIDALGSYEFEGAGHWVIGYVPKRVVDPEELEAWCVELHTFARYLLAQARGDAEASPRLFRWLA